MATRGKLLIVGGGIGGLSAAVAARRVGVEPVVFEAADEVAKVQVGSGISIWAGTMRVFDRLGLRADMERVGARIEYQELRSARGSLLGRSPTGEIAQKKLGQANLSAPRGAFHQVLVDHLPSDTIKLGRRCTGFEQNGDGVTARFADGSEEHGDLLVGADGFGSAIRAQALGEEGARYRYLGSSSWNAVVEFDHERAPKGVQALVYGRGARFLWVPLRGGKLAWVAAAKAPEGERDPASGAKQFLIERFRGWADPIIPAFEATPEEAITRLDIRDRAPVARWGEGRTTLLGDAAHPMTFFLGQGACSSIEDGYVLARRLQAHGTTPEALRAYEASRMDYTGWLVNSSWRIGKLATTNNRALCTTRNASLRVLGPGIYSRFMDRVHDNLTDETAAGLEPAGATA